MSNLLSGSRGAGSAARTAISTAAALALAAAFAGPAGAAPTGTHVIATLPDSSGMELSTYPANTSLAVTLIRDNVPIAHGTAVTDGAGDAAVNGGGTDCWTDMTPDMVAGDVVQITDAAGTFTDTMTVEGTSAELPVKTAPDTVEVHGTAADAQGNPLPITGVEARITSKVLFANGKRLLRAGAGDPFALSYDAPGSTHWTATFSGLSSTDVDLALAPLESRGVFTSAGLNELTISQNPSARGPSAPCTAPLLRDAVTSSSPAAINIAHAGSNLVLSGVSQDASGVAVSLDDQDPSTNAVAVAAVTPTPASGAQTWTATVPAAAIAGLKEGTLTASANYTLAAGTIGGGSLSILKDLVAPGTPGATPSPGTYPTTQAVSLSVSDSTAAIHWTNDGSTPTASSPTLAGGATIPVTATQTIRAVAIDPAGNPGPVATLAYTIAAPAPPAAPAAGGGAAAAGASTGGGAAALVAQRIPLTGSVPVLGGRKAPSGSPALAIRGLTVTVQRHHALRVSMRLPAGTGVVRLRVFRARKGRPTGAPLVTALRLPAANGRYAVTLRAKALRALRSGRYVLEVQAGTSRRSFGTPSRRVFALG